MPTLTTNEICALTGLRPTTLQDWVAKGIVRPLDYGGSGRGNSRRFSLMQAIALAYGMALRRHVGCGPAWVAEAVPFVANLEPARMEEDFAARRTVVLPLPAGQTQLVEMRLRDDAS